MIKDAMERIRGGLVMPGLIAMPETVGIAVDDPYLIAAGTDPHEWMSRIEFVPL